ncbi:hypothetical protein BH23CHL6_BH23CHL6_03370 [soil metagenome]
MGAGEAPLSSAIPGPANGRRTGDPLSDPAVLWRVWRTSR